MAEYLEELEADTGEEIELDIVAIRCEFSEYPTAAAAASEYGFEFDGVEDDADEQAETDALEWLRDRTQVIPFDGGVIIAQF